MLVWLNIMFSTIIKKCLHAQPLIINSNIKASGAILDYDKPHTQSTTQTGCHGNASDIKITPLPADIELRCRCVVSPPQEHPWILYHPLYKTETYTHTSSPSFCRHWCTSAMPARSNFWVFRINSPWYVVGTSRKRADFESKGAALSSEANRWPLASWNDGGNINSDLRELFTKSSLCSYSTHGVSQWASTMSHMHWARCPNGAKNSLRNTCWLGALATVISHLSYVSLLALLITIIKKIHFDPTIQPSSLQRNLSSTHSHLPTQLVAGGLKIKNDQVRPNGPLNNNLTLFQTAWHHLRHIVGKRSVDVIKGQKVSSNVIYRV